MTISLTRRVTLRELLEQAWQQIEGQAREMLKRAVEGLLEAERDRRVAQAQQRGEKVYRWGYTVRKCWTTLWGSLEQVHVPRLRGWKEIGLVERYERHGLDEMLFALTVGGLSQRKVVGWVRRFLGGTLSPATIGAVLEQAQQQVQQRRSEAIPPRRYRAVVVDGIYLRYRRRVSQAPRQGVLLVAVGVREGGGFEVLDWRGALTESTADYEELLTQLWRRGLESVELIVSDGAEAIRGAALRCALAVGRTGDGPEIPGGVGSGAGLLGLSGALATSATHHQLGRRLVQTPAALPEPFPRMPQRRAQRAGAGLLPARRRADASLRSSHDPENPQPCFQQKCWTVPRKRVRL